MVAVVGINYEGKIANSVASSLILTRATFYVFAGVIAPEVASYRIAIIPNITSKPKKPNLVRVIDEIVMVKQVI